MKKKKDLKKRLPALILAGFFLLSAFATLLTVLLS